MKLINGSNAVFSLGLNIAEELFSNKYLKNHLSLSGSVKFKNKKYTPPKNYKFGVKLFCGTKIEILSPNSPYCRYAIVHFHGGGSTRKTNGMYRRVSEKLSELSNAEVYSIDYKRG